MYIIVVVLCIITCTFQGRELLKPFSGGVKSFSFFEGLYLM